MKALRSSGEASRCATIAGNERDPIPLCPVPLRLSGTNARGRGVIGIRIYSGFERDSVIQFPNTCRDRWLSLTPEESLNQRQEEIRRAERNSLPCWANENYGNTNRIGGYPKG
jgi:hypothetical protein